MKKLRALLALALVALAVPELSRYSAERQLYRLTGLMQLAAIRGVQLPESRRNIRQISVEAAALRTYPGDWRPLQLAGRASVIDGNPQRALEIFARALRDGERPEIDFNVGLAYLTMGNGVAADAAFLRASWINPAIAHLLEQRGLSRYATRITAMEQSLQAGRLTLRDIPPAPLATDRR